jgi:hypothetical protein
MMIFLTIVFLTYYLIMLAKGNIYYDTGVKIVELELEKQTNKNNYLKTKLIEKEQLNLTLPLLLLIPFCISQIIYLIYAIGIDIHKYPTIFMILYSIFTIVKGQISQRAKNKTENKDNISKIKTFLSKNKKRSFNYFLSSLIHVSYFGYMFYLLTMKG